MFVYLMFAVTATRAVTTASGLVHVPAVDAVVQV